MPNLVKPSFGSCEPQVWCLSVTSNLQPTCLIQLVKYLTLRMYFKDIKGYIFCEAVRKTYSIFRRNLNYNQILFGSLRHLMKTY